MTQTQRPGQRQRPGQKQNHNNLINYLFTYSGYIVNIICFMNKYKPKSKKKYRRKRK
jgi:hypothetical protein